MSIVEHALSPVSQHLRKLHSQSYQHIQTSRDTYKWSFFPHTIIQWNMLLQHTVQSTTIDILREHHGENKLHFNEMMMMSTLF
jgi:hypothetical protein